ncbi:MMPL family transporter [Nocardioides insulae]|uniref:MMPL family transporter n=1 Tax=Nocardioides insulae TaxID=394734 RepID=UPI00040CFD69|nr:MMPL family transporter [Nocardioides insulae]
MHTAHPAARFVTGARTAWLVALVPLVLALAGTLLLGEGERTRLPTDSIPEGYDSTRVVEVQESLAEDGDSSALVLFTAQQGELTPAEQQDLTRLAQSAGAVPPSVQVAEDGSAMLAVVPIEAESSTATIAAVDDLRAQLDDQVPDGVDAQVTGAAGVEADLARVFDGADLRLLLATASVVAVLLVITYRSPVLWLIPLAVVGVADRFAAVLATQVMARLDVAWDESTVGILSVLVFGAGTDYALLLISRYRDELRRTPDRRAAMAHALTRTVEAVLASSVTVVLGLLTLLLSLTPTTRGLGLACAIGVVVAAFFVLVVLPSALVCFGRWVFWPRVPRVGEAALVDRTTLWSRVGGVVRKRPAWLVAGTLVLLGVLASGTTSISVGLDQADQFLEKPEAIAAAERLAQSFPAGAAEPAEIVTAADPAEVAAAASSSEGAVSAQVVAQGSGMTQIDVVLEAPPGSDQAEAQVQALREAVGGFEETYVGGQEASAIDERDAAARDRLVIMPLILLLVLVSLVVLLRSVLAPVLLVATVVATYAASLGAAWWLFQGPLGFSALDNQVPLYAFLFLVALGVDYNIFLVTRAREEATEHGTRTGMLRALAATGGVITSAGILLGAVFAVLGVLPLVVLAQLGVVVCLGVLLDTLLVRTVLVPSLAVLLGERFWWPARPAARSEGLAESTAGRGISQSS